MSGNFTSFFIAFAVSMLPAYSQATDAAPVSQAAIINSCDLLAASPLDPALPPSVSGVAIERIDSLAAISACRAALEQHPVNTRVIYQLGRALYASGDADNMSEAVGFLQSAADKGNALAQQTMGVMYQRGEGGLNVDEAAAAGFFKLASAQGFFYAQNNLGRMYLAGLGGLERDEVKAAELFKLAAAKGNAPAQYNLGRMYEEGQGGLPKDDAEAVRLYLLAAAQGNASAQYALGRMYEEGRGSLERDSSKALKHYSLSANSGNQFARERMNILSAQAVAQ